ncbi:glycerate kinase [Rhodococcus rhodnii]|uniref:Glycerate kinase n=2 Tax=Rhodococcus rhodnii TaxID=38312 RepID=R7WSA4_9NOCA|nr:glycerate kinase [Rhodococcus rhodnii]EOM78180.1 glycerate kinase [Rhodococcus rhodnii LMG 5362]TXG91438.1 glycerate kinase [Rhodococcus rhodnii]
MRVLIAPDSFGDTLTAVEACDAIARGWSAARPGDVLERAPQSDGGPGFVDVLAVAGGTVHRSDVAGPLGAPVEATWLLDGDTAYLESAQACGLHLLGGAPTPRTAVAATTHGVGTLIAAALAAGARRIVVGLGGSGTSDGGRGMIEALGGLCPASEALGDVALVAATDVENPLLGPDGAAAIFGPQKGADDAAIAILDERNARWAAEILEVTGRSVAESVGAGAAGGLGAALFALGATREAGAAIVARRTGRHEQITGADVVVTGEGRLDRQSLRGKLVTAVAAAARDGGAAVLAFAGAVELDDAELAGAGVDAAHAIVDFAGSLDVAMNDAAHQLEGLARSVAERWSARP